MKNPYPEITPLLKSLRLSGMLETLDIRDKEAIANKLPYSDFLSMMLQDEIARREQKQFTQRLKKSNMKAHKTLEQFNFDFNPKIEQRAISDLATCRFVQEKVAVLLVGPCGTGKSHIAQALGHCALRQGISVLFYTQSQLVKTTLSGESHGTI